MLENLTMIAILRARDTVEDLRGATTFAPLLSRLFPVAVVFLLGFGIALVAHSHEFKFGQGWIDLSLGLVIVLVVTGIVVQGPRIDAIVEAVREGSGPLSPDLIAKTRDPVLRLSAHVPTSLAVGILFMMARQPDWTGAWLTVGVFLLIGIGVSLAVSRLAPAGDASPAA